MFVAMGLCQERFTAIANKEVANEVAEGQRRVKGKGEVVFAATKGEHLLISGDRLRCGIHSFVGRHG